eukprot:CAMPEP_0179160590 /NCGR_PEP_ID=MMETSP0796-20121207/78535_1 /TAXON_ID=73915 /ORGANISM="Pyrodinium bahamense, Strain pbaha01" /LENGTH=188 /DNA_ID=CAMNT_0020862559 /DNA_START=89 /DNA_END=650 /DNA_ORIENTATION=+
MGLRQRPVLAVGFAAILAAVAALVLVMAYPGSRAALMAAAFPDIGKAADKNAAGTDPAGATTPSDIPLKTSAKLQAATQMNAIPDVGAGSAAAPEAKMMTYMSPMQEGNQTVTTNNEGSIAEAAAPLWMPGHQHPLLAGHRVLQCEVLPRPPLPASALGQCCPVNGFKAKVPSVDSVGQHCCEHHGRR